MSNGIHLRLIPGGQAPMAPAEPVDFDRVFREYAAYVAAIGLKIMGRDDDLDDLVQGPVGSGTGAVVCRTPLGCVRRFQLRAGCHAGAILLAAPADGVVARGGGGRTACFGPQPVGDYLCGLQHWPAGAHAAAEFGADADATTRTFAGLQDIARRVESRHRRSHADVADDINAVVFGELGFERQVDSAEVRSSFSCRR